MSHYSRGVAVEREIISLFKQAGWDVVRGAGSKGRALGIDADFVCTKQTLETERTCYLVVGQVKLKKRKSE
jgi:Holliday junction resolvase